MHETTKFVVAFDLPEAVYFPGQVVSGYVHAVFQKKESCRSISVKCKGKSEVEWSESTRESGSDRREVYRSSEHYFTHKLTLHGDETQDSELEAGEYRFPFQFLLPPQLPSSYEGTYGNVRYIVKAKMDRPWAVDYEFKKAFTVNTVVDLNLMPEVKEPVRNEDTKHLCCWCCRSGPITARAWINHSGYVPGETIFFCGEVDNKSGRTLDSTKLRLVERSVFRAKEKKKTEERTVQESTRGVVEDNNSETWDNVPIVVPPLPPSGLPGCNLISVAYFLEFIVDPATFSFNLVIPLEIIIGTVPLRSNFVKFIQPGAAAAPSAPPPELAQDNTVPYPVGGGGFMPPFPVSQYTD